MKENIILNNFEQFLFHIFSRNKKNQKIKLFTSHIFPRSTAVDKPKSQT